MKEQASTHRLESQSDQLDQSRIINKSVKIGEILRIQSEIRRMRRLAQMEINLKKSKQEIQKVSTQIVKYENQLTNKRKEIINENLMVIEQRKKERDMCNKQTNLTLAKIKQQHKERRKRMESLVNQYKQQYDHVYQNKLKQRKQKMKINFQEIHEHQHQYIAAVKRRRSMRVKTQNARQTQRSSFHRSPQRQVYDKQQQLIRNNSEIKRQLVLDLVKRRKQYGQRIEKEAASIKISADLLKKVRQDKSKEGFDKMIDKYQQQKKQMKKPKLDTNFNGNIDLEKSKQISKIEYQYSPVKEKLTRLKNLVEGYTLKYDNGDSKALDKMCDVSILRAKLLLTES